MRQTYTESNSNYTFAVLIAITIVFCLIIPIFKATTTHNYTVTVTDKGYSGEEDGYLIWCEDTNGTCYEFSNNDQWLKGKFNSSTVQGKIKVGSTYKIKTSGWRLPMFNSYENIIEYELIDSIN